MLHLLVSSRFFCSKAFKKTTRKNTPKSIKKQQKTCQKLGPQNDPKSDPKRDPKWDPFGPRTSASRLLERSGMPAAPPRTPAEVLRGFQEPPGTLLSSILTLPGAVWESILTSQGAKRPQKLHQGKDSSKATTSTLAFHNCRVGGCPR